MTLFFWSINMLSFLWPQWHKPDECRCSKTNNTSYTYSFIFINAFGSLFNASLNVVLRRSFCFIQNRGYMKLYSRIFSFSTSRRISTIFLGHEMGQTWYSVIQIYFFNNFHSNIFIIKSKYRWIESESRLTKWLLFVMLLFQMSNYWVVNIFSWLF